MDCVRGCRCRKPAAFLSEEYSRGVGSEPFHQGPLPRPERFTTRTMVVGSLNQSGAIAVLIARISTGFIKAKSLFCHSSSTLPAQVLHVNYKLHFRSVK